MADSKITALTALTAADPINDMLPIVDVSDTTMAASGTTKKISVNNILGASGTATLASATITGELTVDTSTLVVNPAGYPDRVGIGTATPVAELHVIGGANFSDGTTTLRAVSSGNVAFLGTITTDPLVLRVNSIEQYRIAQLGVFTWSDGAGGTRMTLNSTGLGIGASPTGVAKLYAKSGAVTLGAVIETGGASSLLSFADAGTSSYTRVQIGSVGNTLVGIINGVQALTLDASGNLLITKTSVSGTTLGCELTATGVISGASANLDNLNIYNTTASAYRFYVSGAGTVFATNTVISAISDARLKENVQDIDVGLAAILSLKPRKFDWKAGKGKDIKGDRGFIAQEFETVFPNLIDEWKDPAPEGEAPYKSVRADLIPVLVKAIQELTARVQTLEAR